MHVAQATARQAGLELFEPVGRDIESVQTPGIAHGGADGKRLAACSSTEIHDHFAPMGVEQQGQQLGAFVLHLDGTFLKQRHAREGRLVVQAQPPGGIGSGNGWKSI